MLNKPSTHMRKAQSAMEYLMTYGWAILIIAVVLGALFSLGVFNGSNLLGNACIAQTGFLCQSPQYVHGILGTTPEAGNIVVILGQNTGNNWATANFVFVPQGTSVTAGVPDVSFTTTPANTEYNSLGLTSGQQVTLVLPNNALTPGETVTAGSSAATGAIWAQYTIAGSTTGQYAEVATINIKAS